MTAVTINPQPSISRRAWTMALPFVAGGLLGATATFALTSDGSGATTARAPFADSPAPATVVNVSPTAAERWALAELDQQVDACTGTHRAPDAVAHCLGD